MLNYSDLKPRLSTIGSILGLWGAVLAGPTIATAGGLAPPTSEQPVVTSADTSAIGNLAWEITEVETGKVLGKGKREVKMNEVQVISDEDRDYLEQRIPLSEGFYLKLNSGRMEEEPLGFGMAAGREDKQTFSWEWFTIEYPGIAKKLQEEGTLQFRQEELGGKYEVTGTKFLTDVSMRIMDWDNAAEQDINKIDWRVKILKDSDIAWPTEAGGKVRSAADAKKYYQENPPPPPVPGFWESLVKVASEETSGTRE